MRSELSTASLRPDLPPVYARVVEVSVDCLPRRSSTKAGCAGSLGEGGPFSSCHTNAASYDSACQRCGNLSYPTLTCHAVVSTKEELSILNYEVLRVRA